jgi:hypothetical protein
MTGELPLKIPQAGPAVRLGGRWWPIVAAAGYACVALALLWPLPLRMGRDMAGDPFGDPLLNAWILGWGADRLAAGLQGLWDAPIFYPHADTLAWSEHLLAVTVFVAPAYWLTQNIVFTHNLALLGSIVLAGVGMHLLVFELTGSRGAAWVAGVAFACLPYRAAHITHLQILFAGWMPVALYGLHRFLRDGSWQGLFALVGGFLATGLSNGYYLFYLALPLAIAAAWLLTARAKRGEPLRRHIIGLTAAACLVGAAIAPVAAAYLRVRDTLGFSRHRSDMVHYAARPGDYVKVSPASAVWNGVLPGADAERELFPGVTLTLLAIGGAVAGRHRSDVRLYAVIAALAFLMTLGPAPKVPGHEFATGPYDWFRLIPGAGGLRVPARFAMVVYLAMAVLAGLAVARAGGMMSSRLRIGGAILLCAALFAEGRPAVALTPTTRPLSRTETAYRWLREQPRGAMLELPVGQAAQASRYLAGTLVHRNPIVNGYSGYSSRLADFFGGPPTLEPGQAAGLVDAARAVGVRYLLVHEHAFPDRRFGVRMTDALRSLGPERVEAFRLVETTAILTLTPAAGTPPPVDPPLATAACAAQGGPNTAGPERALDGRVDTRWVSGGRQQGEEWLTIRCPDTRALSGVTFEVARRSLGNYPRRLVVEVSTDGERFRPVFEGSVLPTMARALATTTPEMSFSVPVEPSHFQAVRLRQTARAERDSFWAVDEVRLHGRP